MRQVTITLTERVTPGAWLMLPRPIDGWHQRLAGWRLEGVSAVEERRALNSGQTALFAQVTGTPAITLDFEMVPGTPPAWIWDIADGPETRASAALADEAAATVAGHESERAKIRALVEATAQIFGYGHVTHPFNEGTDSVPGMACMTATGSCVDMNTYILASARAVGLRGQYMAGFWQHPEKSATEGMHCWLSFEADGEILHWDLAHHIKWGVEGGFREALNPAGGRRVTMAAGRGLFFEGPFGVVRQSHFSEPRILIAGEEPIRPAIRVAMTDRDAAAAAAE